MTTQTTKVTCQICSFEAHHLGPHLKQAHSLTEQAYQKLHPKADTVSDTLFAYVAATNPTGKRTPPPPPQDLKVSMAGLDLPVNCDVPADACLIIPPHYAVPKYGKLGDDVKMALIAIASGHHTFIHGGPGTGKDAVVHAFVGMTRCPSAIYQVRPDADIEGWFYTQGFDREGVTWFEGPLLQQLRDGYTTENGQVVPYRILISDFDRASKAQAESMRLVLDSIGGRVMGPQGKVYPVLEGTTIIVTANSAGGGDETGRCISSNPIDASIMDRFQAGVNFHAMDWRDESEICKAKFPDLVKYDPTILDQVGNATKALRAAIEKDEIYAEFTHRGVCNWLAACQALLKWENNPKALLKRAARLGFLDKLPDTESRHTAQRLIDPHLKGGGLPHNLDE